MSTGRDGVLACTQGVIATTLREVPMYRKIIVGTDGSETADKAVAHAGNLAALTGATVHVVCARTRPKQPIAYRPGKPLSANSAARSGGGA